MKKINSKSEELMELQLKFFTEINKLYKNQIEIMKFVTDVYNRIEKMENKNG